jgi:hypothetical protein
VKTLNEKAFQIYEVSPQYKRFDQKFNVTRRHLWDRFEFGEKFRTKTQMDRLEKQTPGYKVARTGYYHSRKIIHLREQPDFCASSEARQTPESARSRRLISLGCENLFRDRGRLTSPPKLFSEGHLVPIDLIPQETGIPARLPAIPECSTTIY